jgi:hypothetical protein
MRHRLNAAAVCALLLTAPLFAVLLAAPAAAIPPPTVGQVVTLSNPFNDTRDLQVAHADTGDAVAAWVENNGSEYTVWSARFSPATGWSMAHLHFAQSSPLYYLQLDIDAGGNASLVWVKWRAPPAVWYGLSPADGSPPPPLLVANVTGQSSGLPAMSVGPDGKAYVFWGEYSSGAYSGWAAVIDATAGVVGPTRIDGGSRFVFDKAILPDGSGATALWCDRNGTRANLTSSYYAPGTGWSSPTLVAENVSFGCYYMAAGIDGAGDITVLFYSSTNRAILEFRRPAGGVWSEATDFWTHTGLETVESLDAEVHPDGTVMATWIEADLYDLQSGFARIWTPGVGWGPVTQYVDRLYGYAQVASAPIAGGGAIAVFSPVANSTYTLGLAYHGPVSGCDGWSVMMDAGVGDVYPYGIDVSAGPPGQASVAFRGFAGSHLVARVAVVSLTLPEPVLVTSPADGTQLTSPVATVEGWAPPGSLVRVSGSLSYAGPDGSFSVAVPILVGTNVLQVWATYGAPWDGCVSAPTTLTVVFDDPVPGLIADLDAARADLNGTAAALAVAQARVDALETSGAATHADLDAARADLDAVQDALAGAESNLTGLALEIDALTAALEEAQQAMNGTMTLDEFASFRSLMQSELDNSSRLIGDAWFEIEATQAELADTEARLAAAEANAQAAVDTNAELSTQVANLSMVASIALLAAIAAVALSFLLARRGTRASSSQGEAQSEAPKE